MSAKKNKQDLVVNAIKIQWPEFLVQQSNFQDPTAEFVCRVYSLFYNDLMWELNHIENIIKNSGTDHASLTFGTDKVYGKRELFRMIRPIMDKITENNAKFSFNDIYQPSSIRTTYYCKCFLNHLVTIKRVKWDLTDKSLADMLNNPDKMQSLQLSIHTLKMELSSKIDEIEEKSYKNPILEDNFHHLQDKYEQILTLKIEKEKMCHQLQISISEKEQILLLKKNHFLEAEQQFENLKLLIVDENVYSDLLQNFLQCKENIKEQEKEIERLCADLREDQSRDNEIKLLINEIKKLNVCSNMMEENNTLKQAISDLSKLEECILAKEITAADFIAKIKDLQNKIIAHDKEIQNIQNKFAKTLHEIKNKQICSEELTKKLSQELRVFKMEMQNFQYKEEDLKRLGIVLRQQVDVESQKFFSSYKNVLDKYHKLLINIEQQTSIQFQKNWDVNEKRD